MKGLRLRFPTELERQFQDQYLRTFIKPMRVFWVLALLLWVSGAFSDSSLFPRFAGAFLPIRVGVGLCIAAVVALLLSPWRGSPFVRPFAASVISLAGIGYVAMLAMVPLPEGFSIFTLVLCLTAVASAFVSILRFDYALASCTVVVLAFELCVFVVTPIPASLAVRASLTLVGLSAVGLFSCYGTERYARENFLQRRALQEQAEALADKMEQVELSEHRAQQASRAKSVFLSNMSHELRTPLNAVIGFAQLLERDPTLGPEGRVGLGAIQRSGEHLLGLINDVLSIAKIEAGKITLSEKPFSLLHLLHEVEAIVRTRAEAKGLRLALDVDAALPEMVLGDEGKLRQVLINLVGNAVKFTHAGSVTLRARWRGESPGQARAYFEVEDTGQGISEEELGTLFEAFTQTDSGRSSKEGTGLGLVISRQIVNLMDGDISVRSEPGVGSAFSFDVVLPIVDGATSGDSRGRVVGLAPGQAAQRILVVDDQADNRLLLGSLLLSAGFEVREAADGAQAVEVSASWLPHLIFMDMRMPVMDGREATRRIRSLETQQRPAARSALITQHSCKIIALTASAFEHERDEILSNGCDGFVTKPFRVGTIFDTLADHLGVEYTYERRPEARAAAAAGEAPVSRADLEALPSDLVRDLHSALAGGDMDEATAVAERIRAVDEATGRALVADIRAFDIDRLLSLLESPEQAL